MYVLHLYVHLHLTETKVHVWEVWGKLVRLILQITKFVAALKTTKRGGTIVQLGGGVECLIESLGLIREDVLAFSKVSGLIW